MLKLKKITFVLLILISLLLINLSGCTAKPSASNQVIDGFVNNVISAMQNINTYQLDMNLTNGYSYVTQNNNQFSVEQWQWQSQRTLDLKMKQMKMEMDSGDGVSKNTWEAYITGGQEFFNTISPVSKPGSSWIKINQSSRVEAFLSLENQIPSQIELLQTAKEFYITGNENINGVDCFILNVIPAKESISDWVLAQQQPAGLTFILNSRADYNDSYRNSWVRLFIDKSTSLIVRSDVDALFAGKINMGFHASLSFSNINGPVAIQLPPEALNAGEY